MGLQKRVKCFRNVVIFFPPDSSLRQLERDLNVVREGEKVSVQYMSESRFCLYNTVSE